MKNKLTPKERDEVYNLMSEIGEKKVLCILRSYANHKNSKKPSKLDLLPSKILDNLHERISSGCLSQEDIIEKFYEEIEESGVSKFKQPCYIELSKYVKLCMLRAKPISKIALLPSSIKVLMDRWIMSNNFAQRDILIMINKEIEKEGLPDHIKFSYTLLNRYVRKIRTECTAKQKNRLSKIDLLPPEIKVKLNNWILNEEYSKTDILIMVNKNLEDLGFDDNQKVSYSALNRWISKTPYNKRFDLK